MPKSDDDDSDSDMEDDLLNDNTPSKKNSRTQQNKEITVQPTKKIKRKRSTDNVNDDLIEMLREQIDN